MTTPDGFFYVSPYKFHSAAAAERAAIEDYEAAARETTEVATATER